MGKASATRPEPYSMKLKEVQKIDIHEPIKDRKKMEPNVYERAILGKRNG
jgi:hypothetical protein